MRIRKNARKLSPLLFSGAAAESAVAEVVQTHVCRLNQSPWDVIPLQQQHQHAANQLDEAEDSFNENASLGDSIGAVESVASMTEEGSSSAKLSNNSIVVSIENEVMAEKGGDLDENGDGFEKLVDGSWKCEKQFKQEEDYSSFLRSTEINYYSTLNNCSITKKSAAGATVSRRTRPVRASKKAVSEAAGAAGGGSNPYEFYYYSGFGPLWGKKRRGRGGGEDGGRNAASPSEIDGEDLDYVEDDDDEEEEEEEEEDGGKKRMRKPVKARSLKSLM